MIPLCLTDLMDDVLPVDLAAHCPALLPVNESVSDDPDWIHLDPVITAAIRANLSAVKP